MSARLCLHCQTPLRAGAHFNARHCSAKCRARHSNRLVALRKKQRPQSPRFCAKCGGPMFLKHATAKYCSAPCGATYSKRPKGRPVVEDISAAEIDRRFEAEAARKRALRWRAVA